MKQEFEQGFRMYYIRSDLNQVDVDQLDDADRERIETARPLGSGEPSHAAGRRSQGDIHADS